MQLKEYFWATKEQRSLDSTRVGLVQLAFPIMLESILRATVGMVDVAFLSVVSDTVVSSVSISNQFIMFCQIIATALATGATVYINQAIGMKNQDKVNMFATVAILANTLMGLLFGALFLAVPQMFLKIMTLEADAVDTACRYLQICGGMMVFQCIEIVMVNLCRSLGRIKAPLIVHFFSNIVNVAGNYLAIYHADLFWNVDPVAGVAVASVLSRVTAMLISMFLVRNSKLSFSFKFLRPFPKSEVKLILAIGIPGGINSMAYSLSQIVTTSIISLLGISMVAAKVYVSNIVQYVALISQAFCNACTILVGYRIGAGEYDEAKKIRSIVTKIALLSNGVISLALMTVRFPLLRMFTQDEAILVMAANIFFIDFFVEIGRALNNSLSGALQAVGDVRFSLIVNQGCGWILAVGGAYLFAILLNMGLYGVWIAFACDELIRGNILLWRWRSNRWMSGAEAKRKIIAVKSP